MCDELDDCHEADFELGLVLGLSIGEELGEEEREIRYAKRRMKPVSEEPDELWDDFPDID